MYIEIDFVCIIMNTITINGKNIMELRENMEGYM